jgi:hypothetical protein
MIAERHDIYLHDFEDPIISNLENKTFYTDVQGLRNALDKIFECIQNRSEHRLVSYKLIDQNKEVYVLEILHHESFNIGKSIYDEKLQAIKGSFGDISAQLRNLCDWSIESKFKEGYYRINYLTSEESISKFEKIENVSGFKYILTFYK